MGLRPRYVNRFQALFSVSGAVHSSQCGGLSGHRIAAYRNLFIINPRNPHPHSEHRLSLSRNLPQTLLRQMASRCASTSFGATTASPLNAPAPIWTPEPTAFRAMVVSGGSGNSPGL